MLETIVIVFSE